jgi:tetratricopeptide (TPR) repeat protein
LINRSKYLARFCMHVQLASLLLPLRRTLHSLSQYKAREALSEVAQLPPTQLGSAGVLLLIGRCQYELVDYTRAAEAFEAARAADPLSLEVRGCCAAVLIYGMYTILEQYETEPGTSGKSNIVPHCNS